MEGDRNNGRFTGWKEIAGYLGKSVRTVQRWERELGLPVRRIQATGGEIVYASRDEIESWLVRRAAPPPDEQSVPALASEPDAAQLSMAAAAVAESRRRRLWPVAIIGASILLTAAGILVWRVLGRDAQPAIFKVLPDRLHVYDGLGKLIWEHRTEFQLNMDNYKDGARRRHVWVGDLDGDGANEVLFLALGLDAWKMYCLNRNGKVRFTIGPEFISKTVEFADQRHVPLYFLLFFLVTSEGKQEPAPKSIWLVWQHHRWLPSVVQKLTPDKRVVDEYWSNGHVTAVAETESDGRRYMLIGGINSEFDGASMAILDYDRPSGSAPAENPKYLCRNCPEGRPSRFYVLPKLDVARTLGSRAVLWEFFPRVGETLTFSVHQGVIDIPEPSRYFVSVLYHLNGGFSQMAAQFGDAYVHGHGRLHVAGKLDHPLGSADERELVNVRAWNGEKFVPLPVTLNTYHRTAALTRR